MSATDGTAVGISIFGTGELGDSVCSEGGATGFPVGILFGEELKVEKDCSAVVGFCFRIFMTAAELRDADYDEGVGFSGRRGWSYENFLVRDLSVVSCGRIKISV